MQVGAFAQDANAQAMVVRLTATGFEGTVIGIGDDLRRVVAFAGPGESAEELARRLRQAGFNEQRQSAAAAVGVVVEGEGGASLRGPRVRVVPIDPDPVKVGTKTVRGELELRPGITGVAVVNVVSLEEYLRGVVPAEMGPRAFPLLEALKAQAVAARTYAVAHLGDHSADGYDLCDSQMCQVYEGAGAEQPLSDRAVLETSGEILTWRGQPIDAMYHSTCAGRTEDAAAVFPQRGQPYLKGVRCRGERMLTAGVSGSAGPWLGEVDRLAAVGGRIAGALGVPAQGRALAARLTGVSPEAGDAGLVRAFRLGTTAATLHIAGGASAEDSTLELLRVFRLQLPPPSKGSGRLAWEMALVVRLGQLAGSIQAVSGRLVPGPSGVRLVVDGSETARDLNGREALLERRGVRWRLNAIEFPAGSPATLWCSWDVCPAVEVEPLDDADAGSAWSWWVREISLEELGGKLSVAGAREVTVTRRGLSGRALTVAVTGSGGRTEFAGLAFRRALELPDTLFVVVAARNAKSQSVRFLGRGWGHGVGMCQNGAFGLARGGAGYEEILKTYYTGVELAHWEGGDHEHEPEAGKRGP
jgi:stage II sporulation protein D